MGMCDLAYETFSNQGKIKSLELDLRLTAHLADQNKRLEDTVSYARTTHLKQLELLAILLEGLRGLGINIQEYLFSESYSIRTAAKGIFDGN